jgi:hypothetical protein
MILALAMTSWITSIEEPAAQFGDLASVMHELDDQPTMSAGCGLDLRNLHQPLFRRNAYLSGLVHLAAPDFNL